MRYSMPDRDSLELIREAAVDKFVTRGWPYPDVEDGKTIVDIEIKPFAWEGFGIPVAWGLWPRWKYDRRPDIQTPFGGPFIRLSAI